MLSLPARWRPDKKRTGRVHQLTRPALSSGCPDQREPESILAITSHFSTQPEFKSGKSAHRNTRSRRSSWKPEMALRDGKVQGVETARRPDANRQSRAEPPCEESASKRRVSFAQRVNGPPDCGRGLSRACAYGLRVDGREGGGGRARAVLSRSEAGGGLELRNQRKRAPLPKRRRLCVLTTVTPVPHQRTSAGMKVNG